MSENLPKICPKCRQNKVELLYEDSMQTGCEYEATVSCRECGDIGSVTFYPTMKRGTFCFID